jgi:hypothetical protein
MSGVHNTPKEGVMPDEGTFDVEAFAEGVKQSVIAAFPPGGIISRGCSCCTCWTPVGPSGGEIAEFPQDEE